MLRLGLGLFWGFRSKVRLHRGSLRLVVIVAVHGLSVLLRDRLGHMRGLWLRVWREARRVAPLPRKTVGLCGELALSGFFVPLAYAFVPLALGEVDHPVATLAWLSDRPLDLEETLPQRQIMPDGVL